MDDQLSYELQDGILFLRFYGDYTLEDFIDLFRRGLADPATPPKTRVLIDLRKSKVERTTEDVKTLVEEFTKAATNLDRVAVVTASEVHHGLALMGSFFIEESGLKSSVFRHYDVAMDFLQGVD